MGKKKKVEEKKDFWDYEDYEFYEDFEDYEKSEKKKPVKLAGKKLSVPQLAAIFAVLAAATAGILFTVGFSGKKTDPKRTETDEAYGSEVIFFDKQFFIHAYGPAFENDRGIPDADHTIGLDFIYQGELPKIRFIRFDNPRADEALVDLDYSDKSEKFESHRGYRYGCLKLNFDYSRMECGEDIPINTLNIYVDGKERTLDFTGRMILSRYSEEEEQEWEEFSQRIGFRSDGVETDVQSPADYQLSLVPKEKITIQKIEFGDGLSCGEAGAYRYKFVAHIPLPVTVPADVEQYVEVPLTLPEDGGRYFYYTTEMRLYCTRADGTEAVFRKAVQIEDMNLYAERDRLALRIDQVLGFSKEEEEQVYFLQDHIRRDVVFMDQAMIELPFLYQDHLPYITVSDVDGKSGSIAAVKILYRDHLQNYAYKEYKTGKLTVLLDWPDVPSGTKIEVNALRLSVDGVERTIDTTGRLSFLKAPDRKYQEFNSTHVISDTEMISMMAENQTEVENFEIYGQVIMNSVKVEGAGEPYQSLEGVFPFTLERDEIVSVEVQMEAKNPEPFTDTCYSMLLYYTDGVGEKHLINEIKMINGTGLSESNEYRAKQQYKKFIDYWLETQGKETPKERDCT